MSTNSDELEKISRRIDSRFEKINFYKSGINEIKTLKNDIFQQTSTVFVDNLKKLIQLEGTQKKLSSKIGVSEDLLSKYKSAEAFPAIETLIYISKLYNIDLDKLLSTPLSMGEIETMIEKDDEKLNIFENSYYSYFFVTNKSKENSIHEGILNITDGYTSLSIISNGSTIKSFNGKYKLTDKLVFFEFTSENDGNAYINLIRPNININKYVGGLGLMILPCDANSKPCVQSIILSKYRIDRDKHYGELKKFLSFHNHLEFFGSVKISQMDDEQIYNFILELQNQ